MSTSVSCSRPQSLGEEIANAISHGLGFGLAVAVLPVLVVAAVRHGSAADVVGAALFAATMAVLYLASTLYHALPPGRAKAWAGRVDHAEVRRRDRQLARAHRLHRQDHQRHGGVDAQAMVFDGVAEALAVPGSDLRLFGKPESFVKRRMGVALVHAEDTDTARERAKLAAGKVRPRAL